MLTLTEELKMYYPNGIVCRLTENKSLYYRVWKEKSVRGFSDLGEFLETLGFKYSNGVDVDVIKDEIKDYLYANHYTNNIVISKLPESIKYQIYRLGKSEEVLIELGYAASSIKAGLRSNFDYFSIRKILEEYSCDGLNGTKLADLVGTSKQQINNIIRNKVQDRFSGDSWKITELSEDETEIILDMIIEQKRKATLKGMNITLYVNGLGKTMIWMCSEDKTLIRVMFDEDVPEDIRELFKESKIPFYFEDELVFLNSLQLIHIVNHRYVKNGTFSTTKWKTKCEKYAKRRDMTIDEYYEYINVCGVARHEFSFEEVSKQLLEVANEDNAVSSTNKKVSAINRHFRHYRFERPELQPEYQQFQDLSSYLEFHGYHLMGHHAFSEEHREHIKAMTDARYKAQLQEYILYPGSDTVAFNYTDPIFNGIYQLANIRGISLNDYIKALGYKYIRKAHSSIESIIGPDDDLLEDGSEIDIFSRILDEYTSQSLRNKNEFTAEQFSRNRKLVMDMKKIYSYRCQLCDEKNRSIEIDMGDGMKYVEVHHIIPNADGEDEEGSLDRPGNMIIVCPNHHKYLHYHKGGNYKLQKWNGGMILKNDYTHVKVAYDLHLEHYYDMDTIRES